MEIACVLVPDPALRAVGEGRGLPPEEVWEDELRRLEGIGAGVESERPGEAFFGVDGLFGIHGGDREGVLDAARGALSSERAGAARASGAALSTAASIGTGPTRFAALIAAQGLRGAVPVATLCARLGLPPREAEDLGETLGRLGVGTVEAFAALSPDRVADRFGEAGRRAHLIARGEEPPLRPRRPPEDLAAEVELPEGTAGNLLDRALELLVDRFLAAPQRRGRTLLALRLGALLSDGGSWSAEQGLGRPTASPRTLRALLAPRLEALPAPAITLRLRAIALGPPAGDQLELSVRGQELRRHRLADAVREVRAAQGPEALLKILPVDPASRVPERRGVLTPFPL